MPSAMDNMSMEEFVEWYDEAVHRIKEKNRQIEHSGGA